MPELVIYLLKVIYIKKDDAELQFALSLSLFADLFKPALISCTVLDVGKGINM